MKIIINKNGKLEDVPDKVASRLINKGKAHPAQIGGIVESKIPIKQTHFNHKTSNHHQT